MRDEQQLYASSQMFVLHHSYCVKLDVLVPSGAAECPSLLNNMEGRGVTAVSAQMLLIFFIYVLSFPYKSHYSDGKEFSL